MAKILVTGGLGWDIPIWLDGPLRSGARIRAHPLMSSHEDVAFTGRLGGGAANIAAALACSGHDVWVCGRIGEDSNGAKILQALNARRVHTDFVDISLVSTTSVHILIEPSGERTIIGFGGPSSPDTQASPLTSSLLAELEREAFDCLIMRSGWPKLALRPRLILAHTPTHTDETLDADVIVGGISDLPDDAALSPLATVRRSFPKASWGIFTNGTAGLIAQSETLGFEIRPDPVIMVDATGAGDVFMAGLADGLLAGGDMEAACRHAAKWGGICVGLHGSAPEPDETRYERFIHEPNAI
jgi:ribokinase